MKPRRQAFSIWYIHMCSNLIPFFLLLPLLTLCDLVIQIRVQRLGPGMVQQFQSRCGDCGGQGERIRGSHYYFVHVIWL